MTSAPAAPKLRGNKEKHFYRACYIFYRVLEDGSVDLKVFTSKRRAFDFAHGTEDGKAMKLYVHTFN